MTSASQYPPETLEESDETNSKQDELKRHLRTITNKNQQLEAECAQLKRLLKDYETGLESATSSMRLQVVSLSMIATYAQVISVLMLAFIEFTQ